MTTLGTLALLAASVIGAPADDAAAPIEQRTKVAIMIDAAVEADAEQVADELALALEQTRQLQPITRRDVVRLLSFEEQRQALGCDEPACFADLGRVLAARYLVSGKLTAQGAHQRLSLQLVDTQTAEVLGRLARTLPDDPAAAAELEGSSVRVLVRPLLDLAAGDVAVIVNEPDAKVFFDDRLIGLSPVNRLALPGGMHPLRVELEGFHPVERDVRILPGDVVAEQVTLIPSQAFIAAYRSQTTDRSHLGMGLAVAGGVVAGVATGLFVWEQANASALATDILAFNTGPRADAAARADLEARRTAVMTRAVAWLVSGVIGVVTGAVGGYLWATAGDPERYAAFQEGSDASAP